MIERVSLCSSNSPLGLIINELHRMTLRGTVKQYVYDITNHMSLESCRKLRGLTHLLSEQNLQEEIISCLLRRVSAGSGKGKLLSEIILLLTDMTVFHCTHKSNPDIVDNVAAVFYAVTTNDSVNELVRVLAYSSLSEITSVVRKVDYLHMYSTPPSSDFLKSYHNCLLVSGAVTPEQQDFVLQRLAESKNLGPNVVRRCINMFPAEKTKELLEFLPDLTQMSPQNIIYCSSIFPTEQVTKACMTVLKTSNTKQHLQMLSFHILLQQKIGGQYPSLFFRVVWKVYHNSKRDQTLRGIEQTVRVMLFDQPKYSLYAVNFLNSIPFDLYSPTLLEVLLQLVEFVTTQPVSIFKSASDHYMRIFQHYLTLLTYDPTPVIRHCTRLAEEEELDAEQIVALTDMINSVLHHPKLASLTADLSALCRALSRFPLQQSYMLLLYRYLTTYSTSKLQASLFGESKFMSGESELGGLCTYLERPMLKLDKICLTISRKKYVNPAVSYTEFDTSFYLEKLHLTVTLAYCVHLAREDEYLTCVEFQLTPHNLHYNVIESVYVPVLRSGDTISVALETERPAPASIKAGIEYTQHNHHYRSVLPELIVLMTDLLCPLPLSNFSADLVFSKLWEWCEQHQKSKGDGEAMVSMIKPGEGFRIKLSSFKLPDNKTDKTGCYMFGLPPRHFVLLLCVPQFSTMKIAIDSWEIFPLVYKLLTSSLDE
ncbi:hypothetical protein ACHWQZ_G007850 [Mnemiopsis leidyi]